MKMRRAVSGLVAGVLLAFAVPAAAVEGPPPAQLSEQELAAIRRVEGYLNGIATLQARFLQVSSDGGSARGTLSVSRPGKLRIEYDPPTPILIVTAGDMLAYYDRQLEQVSYVPVSRSPAALIVSRNVSLLGGDVRIVGFEQEANALRVSVVREDDPLAGRVTLVFEDAPLALRKWQVVDAQGIETTVSLMDLRAGIALDESLFRWVDPLIVRPADQ